MNITISAISNLSRPAGDTVRIISLAEGLGKRGFNVNLVTPIKDKFSMILPDYIKTYSIDVKSKKTPINIIIEYLMLILKANKVQKNTISRLQIESSVLGGYFALAGYSNYILDIHGLAFDEVRYSKLPWYIPPKIYQKYMSYLEKLAIKRASKVIAVSNPMKDFFIKEWKIPEEKIEVIPNGYFEEKIKNFRNIKETKGMISFVGVLAGWANVDKVIDAARALKKEDAHFYIVGDGRYRSMLENMVKKYNLNNVTFTGFVPIEKAYEIMAKSEILLAPFPKTLALEVACPPIKRYIKANRDNIKIVYINCGRYIHEISLK